MLTVPMIETARARVRAHARQAWKEGEDPSNAEILAGAALTVGCGSYMLAVRVIERMAPFDAADLIESYDSAFSEAAGCQVSHPYVLGEMTPALAILQTAALARSC